MLSEVQSKCGVSGGTELHEHVNDELEQEPQGGEAKGPQERREDGLTSTTRQERSWEKRGGWGKVTMNSRGVEISIAGGVREMVRDLSLGGFFPFFFIVIMRYLF